MKELQQIRSIANSKAITDDLYQRFISYIDASDKTISTYRRAIRQTLNYFKANNIAQPTREDILAYRDTLKADHKPTTVQLYITVTRLFFQWTEQEGIYPNIAEHIKGARLDREHKKDYLTSGQTKALLADVNTATLTGKRDYAILAVMITCGLRTIEISRANIEDICAKGDNTVIYIQGKGREERTEYIKIEAPVEAAIRSYLQARGKADAAAPLFTSTSNNSKGRRLTTRSISGIVKKSLIAAGYDSDRLTAHSMRHTAVTLSLLAGKDLAEVQQFARHANISTTQIYNHALDKQKNSCSEAIADSIF